MGEQVVAEGGHGQDRGGGFGAGGEQEGAVVGRGGREAVAAADEAGVEGDEVEEGSETEFFLDQAAGSVKAGESALGVEEQFAGVVARFAVDVDGAGVVGGGAVVEPEGVGEPGVGSAEGDDLAATGVVEVEGLAFGSGEEVGDPVELGEVVADAGDVLRALDVDVGDLMVADGEGAAVEGIEDFAEGSGAYGEPAGGAEGAVDQDGLRDVDVAVLAEDPDRRAGCASGVEQGFAGVVEFADEAREIAAGGAEALGVVVEVGEVDEGEVGVVGGDQLSGGLGDPSGGGQAGVRSPEGGKGEGSEGAFELVGEPGGGAVDGEGFIAVGGVEGFGGEAEVDVGALVEPPEELGDRERAAAMGGAAVGGCVEGFGLKQGIGLLPEANLPGLAEKPAVADDAVDRGGDAGEQGRLGGAGNGGNDVVQGPDPAAVGQGAETWSVGEQAWGQADGVDQNQWLHGLEGGEVEEGYRVWIMGSYGEETLKEGQGRWTQRRDRTGRRIATCRVDRGRTRWRRRRGIRTAGSGRRHDRSTRTDGGNRPNTPKGLLCSMRDITGRRMRFGSGFGMRRVGGARSRNCSRR